MSNKIQAIRGMNDILPADSATWEVLLSTLKMAMSQYGFIEIKTPIVEQTTLFKRSIGEVTDIVEKEMYTFSDLNGDSLTLRPEGTAGCVRACIEHGLLHHQQHKLWYFGPMFRHERPQKGRYRQFYQMGVEVLGYEGVPIELEVLQLSHTMWERLGVLPHLTLEINTLGSLEERKAYKEVLVQYFKAHNDQLDEDSKRRLETNPLRILDSKNPAMQDLIQRAPRLLDHLGPQSTNAFQQLCDGLEALGIAYRVNPKLVRGLDYYSHTVFEWVTDKLGAQATVLAGGRYDLLVEMLGGPPTPAFGFAMGMERLVLLLSETGTLINQRQPIDVFVMADSEQTLIDALVMAKTLREETTLNVFVNTAISSFKSQFKKADKSGARFALVIGEAERASNAVAVKDLRRQTTQDVILADELVSYLSKSLKEC